MSIVLQGSTSGSVTLQEPAVAGTTVLDLPATSGTIAVTSQIPSAGTGPAFNAYPSSQQSVSTNTWTKVNLQTEYFDTNSNFASSRFTPTVAGYYQINGTVAIEHYDNTSFLQCAVYKNGANFVRGASSKGDQNEFAACNVSTVVSLNGSTDYVELFFYGDTTLLQNSNQSTNFSGALVRSS